MVRGGSGGVCARVARAASIGSGSGHGDPVDVGTAWHSHLIYL